MVTKDNQNDPQVLANIHGIEQQYGVNFDYESDIPLQVQILSLSERMRMIYTDADSDRLALMTDMQVQDQQMYIQRNTTVTVYICHLSI